MKSKWITVNRMKRIFTSILLITLFHATASFGATPTAKEFASGNQAKFSTAGHPKSKGINLVVSYPRSWLAQEGERPNIVQKFFSEHGKGLEGAIIVTKNLGVPPGTVISEMELEELFSPAELKDMLPSGASFIQASSTKIEGLPAGILEYSTREERAGLTIHTQVVSYIFVHNNTLIQFQCLVSTGIHNNQDMLIRKMAEFRPLFTLMANSIVLPDRWK